MDSVAYIKNIVTAVEAYKDARDITEKVFAEVDSFPNATTSPAGVESDEENLQKKGKLYEWSTEGGFPPHLRHIPEEDNLLPPEIFGEERLKASKNPNPGYERFFGGSEPTMAGIENRYRELYHDVQQADVADVYKEANVGLRVDWFTDAVFAQQHFTGVNPTGLRQATDGWISAFIEAATAQDNAKAQQHLSSSSPESLYVVDNSDYRYLLGLAPDAVITAPGTPEMPAGQPAYGCAAVTLFSLSDSGKLHPVAICLDYKGSTVSNVTIFNKRLTPDARSTVDEEDDWPWRYAKMCTMTSDWARHELAAHLTETHLIEEAIIIAAQRNLPDSHIVCKLLHPHWPRTLSLNYLARKDLVPEVIVATAPLELPQIKDFIKASYMTFDFVGRYVPNDLRDRGFDPAKLDDKKFHNYLYARNIFKIWGVLRSFVSDVLHNAYPNGDADVAADKYIAGFSAEMRSQQGGQLGSFPRSAKTLDELIDLVTMCIHIAAPQHSAINYLQQFYLSFVPNRPGSLMTPLPADLETLLAYTEADVVGALPVQKDNFKRWTIMVRIPYLLSAEVDSENNIEEYAAGTIKDSDQRISAAGPAFLENVRALKATFDQHNEEMDDGITKYHVLDAGLVANSILI